MEKLIKIQSELKAPKSQYNNFGKYAYRNAEDILEAAKPLLAKHNCLLILSDEIIHIDGRHYVKATATFIEPDGWQLSVSAQAREEAEKKGMDGSQVTGASSSYARKYALNGLFLIDDTKDSDSTNTHDKEPKPEAKAVTPAPPKTPEQKPTPPQPQTFDKAKYEAEIKAITTKEEMGKYWSANKALQGNEEFKKLVNTYGAKLTK